MGWRGQWLRSGLSACRYTRTHRKPHEKLSESCRDVTPVCRPPSPPGAPLPPPSPPSSPPSPPPPRPSPSPPPISPQLEPPPDTAASFKCANEDGVCACHGIASFGRRFVSQPGSGAEISSYGRQRQLGAVLVSSRDWASPSLPWPNLPCTVASFGRDPNYGYFAACFCLTDVTRVRRLCLSAPPPPYIAPPYNGPTPLPSQTAEWALPLHNAYRCALRYAAARGQDSNLERKRKHTLAPARWVTTQLFPLGSVKTWTGACYHTCSWRRVAIDGGMQ